MSWIVWKYVMLSSLIKYLIILCTIIRYAIKYACSSL